MTNPILVLSFSLEWYSSLWLTRLQQPFLSVFSVIYILELWNENSCLNVILLYINNFQDTFGNIPGKKAKTFSRFDSLFRLRNFQEFLSCMLNQWTGNYEASPLFLIRFWQQLLGYLFLYSFIQGVGMCPYWGQCKDLPWRIRKNGTQSLIVILIIYYLLSINHISSVNLGTIFPCLFFKREKSHCNTKQGRRTWKI